MRQWVMAIFVNKTFWSVIFDQSISYGILLLSWSYFLGRFSMWSTVRGHGRTLIWICNWIFTELANVHDKCDVFSSTQTWNVETLERSGVDQHHGHRQSLKCIVRTHSRLHNNNKVRDRQLFFYESGYGWKLKTDDWTLRLKIKERNRQKTAFTQFRYRTTHMRSCEKLFD